MVTTKSPTIFGREPAVVVGFIEAALAALMSFGALNFIGVNDAETLGLVMAVVSAVLGLYVAYVTRDTLLAYVITAFKSGTALAAVYGLDLSAQQSAMVIAAVTAGFSLYQRTQTSPVAPAQHSLALDTRATGGRVRGEAGYARVPYLVWLALAVAAVVLVLFALLN